MPRRARPVRKASRSTSYGTRGCGGEIVVLREISDAAPEHGEGMSSALQMLNGRSPGWGPVVAKYSFPAQFRVGCGGSKRRCRPHERRDEGAGRGPARKGAGGLGWPGAMAGGQSWSCGGEIVVLREISDAAPEHGEGMPSALQMLNGRSPGW